MKKLFDSSSLLALGACGLACGLVACEGRVPEPSARPATSATASPASTTPTLASAQPVTTAASTKPRIATVPVSPDDPLAGKFDLDAALVNLPKEGKLTAEIKTKEGTLVCELFEDKAPITVANFVGLARGLRPFKGKDGSWKKKPGYDGTTFHRIIAGFMIQGGDPEGTGAGEPGYVIPDELWSGARHDKKGQLCMANRGPNTNGMQFFITDGPAPHLDRGYTIFGQCSSDAVLAKLAASEVRGDRAIHPPVIEKVTISRKK